MRKLLSGRKIFPILLMGFTLYAQDSVPRTNILIMADFSLSMGTRWKQRAKIVVLRDAILRIVQEIHREYPQVRIGLRLFGHRSPEQWKDCRDTRLEVPIQRGTEKNIRQILYMYEPRGVTPLAYALSQALRDFPPEFRGEQNVIIIVTDGMDACGGNVCQTIQMLRKAGISVKPFLVGVNLPEEVFGQLMCAGVVGFNARAEEELYQYLRVIVDRVLSLSSLDIAFLDQMGRPTETDLPILIFSHVDSSLKIGALHTLNTRGKPDTLYLSPAETYFLQGGGVPDQVVEEITLEPGSHLHLEIPYPTGHVEVRLEHHTLQQDVSGRIRTLLRTSRNPWTFWARPLETPVRLRAGAYSVDVTTLPPQSYPVQVQGGHTTRVTLPEPGVLVLQIRLSGSGALIRQNEKGSWQTVYLLSPEQRGREVLVLVPGTYRLIFRTSQASHSTQTRVHTFELHSGETKILTLP